MKAKNRLGEDRLFVGCATLVWNFHAPEQLATSHGSPKQMADPRSVYGPGS